jgi:Predicted RNA binding protein (contains ribosomal protein S1 domain)
MKAPKEKKQQFPYRTLGKIVSVQQFGALVELIDTREVGILHISKISERFVSDVQKFLVPDETIWIDVVKKSAERIELSILEIPHYRNVGTACAGEFKILAELLPKWIEDKKFK